MLQCNKPFSGLIEVGKLWPVRNYTSQVQVISLVQKEMDSISVETLGSSAWAKALTTPRGGQLAMSQGSKGKERKGKVREFFEEASHAPLPENYV